MEVVSWANWQCEPSANFIPTSRAAESVSHLGTFNGPSSTSPNSPNWINSQFGPKLTDFEGLYAVKCPPKSAPLHWTDCPSAIKSPSKVPPITSPELRTLSAARAHHHACRSIRWCSRTFRWRLASRSSSPGQGLASPRPRRACTK